jgi:hypothetical protein
MRSLKREDTDRAGISVALMLADELLAATRRITASIGGAPPDASSLT